jgi:hypothetical protein
LEGADQQKSGSAGHGAETRRHPRYKLEVEVRIHSKTCGVLHGRTVDISESGISAMLKIEVPVGELVELQFTLPYGPVTAFAMVRQRNAFRYGFQFTDSAEVREIILASCRELATQHSGPG